LLNSTFRGWRVFLNSPTIILGLAAASKIRWSIEPGHQDGGSMIVSVSTIGQVIDRN
jgi:hypothetical protein